MMEADTDSETLDINSILTWLIVQEILTALQFITCIWIIVKQTLWCHYWCYRMEENTQEGKEGKIFHTRSTEQQIARSLNTYAVIYLTTSLMIGVFLPVPTVKRL